MKTTLSLKKYSACGKQYRTLKEFLDHAMDAWHDELIISSYLKYIDERKTSNMIKFTENNKYKLRGIVKLEYIWER